MKEKSKSRILSLIFSLLILSGIAELSPSDGDVHWLHKIEQYYLAGNLAAMETVLQENQPVNNIERAGHLFYQAKVSPTKQEIVELLEEAARITPDVMYGQRALTELGNIALLERDYRQSLDYLLKVKPQMISLRDYLLSNVYLKLDMYSEAIRAAQDFIKISKDHVKRELAYLQIVEAYIINEQYQQALMTLETMKTQDYTVNEHSIVDFKEGYCLEKLNQYDSAIEKYKYVITRYPYSEHAFQAERRLYDLTLANNEKIDYGSLSFTDTHTETRDRTDVPSTPDRPTGPGDDYYIQVNAFADKDNADDHSAYLKNLGYDNIVFSKTVFDQQLYVVAVGPFSTRSSAGSKQKELKQQLNMESFIIKY